MMRLGLYLLSCSHILCNNREVLSLNCLNPGLRGKIYALEAQVRLGRRDRLKAFGIELEYFVKLNQFSMILLIFDILILYRISIRRDFGKIYKYYGSLLIWNGSLLFLRSFMHDLESICWSYRCSYSKWRRLSYRFIMEIVE